MIKKEAPRARANGAPEEETVTADDLLFEYTLTKPIKAYNEEIKVIKVRKPTGADLVRIGNPVLFSPFTNPPRVEHDMGRVVAMVARLSNVPSSSLEMCDPVDLTGLAWAISPFFIPRP